MTTTTGTRTRTRTSGATTDRGRWTARKRPKDEADDDGADDGGRASPADATRVTDVTSFDVTTLVDQAPLRFEDGARAPSHLGRPAASGGLSWPPRPV